MKAKLCCAERTLSGGALIGKVTQCLQVGEAQRLAADPEGEPVIANTKAASEVVAASICAQRAGELSRPAGSAFP